MKPVDLQRSTRRTEFLLELWARYKLVHSKRFPGVPLISLGEANDGTTYFRADADTGEAKLGVLSAQGIAELEAEHKAPGYLTRRIREVRARGDVPVILGLYVCTCEPLHIVWHEAAPTNDSREE